MAYQSIAPASLELWPVALDAARLPRVSITSRFRQSPKNVSKSEKTSQDLKDDHHSFPPSELPAPLRDISLAALSDAIQHQPVGGNGRGPSPLLSSQRFYLAPHDVLRQARLQPRKLPQTPNFIRLYSTLLATGAGRTASRFPSPHVTPSQSRSLFGQSAYSNLLGHMEKTATNNPQSATAQNAFYQALLRADMPQIVIERYQSGRYATNAACDAAFVRALERVGQAGGLKASSGSLNGNTQSGSLSDAQIQAIAQAIAAHTRGADAAISRNSDGSPDLGNKDKPIYVVTKDTLGSIIFKWFRLFLSYGVGVYLSLMIVSMLIENMGAGVKRLSQVQNNEAQPQHQTARFSDVHGCEEAKEELQELVDFLKSPDKFSALGGKMPKGVLLVGPPGTGKTLLARAVAGEAGVPFFFMSGSEFEEVYVGVGAKRVRELFNAARAKAPAIIFIDELDAVGAKRNERDSAYAKQTLNQLLTELDGFSQTSGIIILAATNFPQLLDKALTRPGRFDRHVVVPLPDVRGRVAILKHHMKSVQVGTDVDPAVIARGTPGLSGAELENIVNQAAIHASRNKSKKVTMHDFEWAKDKIIMGAERRSAVIQEKDKLMTAYHEGGHALVALSTAGANSLYKVTIMPRGQALGVTSQLPEIDKVSISKSEMQAQIDVLMGGKVAEELVYGSEHVTAGVSSDIEQATKYAYAMVTRLGMSDKLGNVDLNSEYERLSSETRQLIDREIRRIVEEARERATKVLTERRKDLDMIAQALMEYETLNRDEIDKILRGEKLSDKFKSDPAAPIKLPEPLVLPGFGEGSSRTAAVDVSPAIDEPSTPAESDGEASSL